MTTVSKRSEPTETRSNRVSPRVLMVTAMYPTPQNPHSGTFVKSQIDSLARMGIPTTVLHLTGHAAAKYALGIGQIVQRATPQHFDLIHGHYGYCGIVGRAQWRLPVVVSFCGDDLLGTPDASGKRTPTSQLAVWSSLILTRVVDGIIVKSEDMRQALPKGLRIPTAVIPNGVDFDFFRPQPQAEARRRLGLDPSRRYAVFPADPAIPRKGYAVAEAAVRRLFDSGTPIELLAVHGQQQSAVVDFLNAADVVVLPSLWEGSPNVVKEAMACGRPIVAADVGDVRAVIGGTRGCAVVERTPEGFASGIRAALAVPDGRTTGRADIAQLALPAVAVRVRDLYGAVLDRSRGGAPGGRRGAG